MRSLLWAALIFITGRSIDSVTTTKHGGGGEGILGSEQGLLCSATCCLDEAFWVFGYNWGTVIQAQAYAGVEPVKYTKYILGLNR